MPRLVFLSLVLSILAAGSLEAQTVALSDRLFWGGGLGLGFGSVDYVDLSPMIGIDLTKQVSTGIQLTYRYRNDSRYSPDLSTTDYGGRVFGRYSFTKLPVFLHAEYELLSYEYVRSDDGTDRDTLDSLLAGGGYFQSIGPNTVLSMTALYNFSYDGSDPTGPYSDPWTFRVGITARF